MNPVNLFFACDNAYVPFLAVTLTSLKENGITPCESSTPVWTRRISGG